MSKSRSSRRAPQDKADKSPPVKRQRLTAEAARAAILEAAERRLLEVGPQGLRLQEIARDVGISHPTVLHHFGSRDGLVEAVATGAVHKLEQSLLDCFTELDATAVPGDVVRDALDRVDAVLRKSGYARLLAWLALSGLRGPRESLLRNLAVAIHAALTHRGEDVELEQVMFRVVASSAAMFGMALVGSELLSMVGLPDDDALHARFRDHFAEMLIAEAPEDG